MRRYGLCRYVIMPGCTNSTRDDITRAFDFRPSGFGVAVTGGTEMVDSTSGRAKENTRVKTNRKDDMDKRQAMRKQNPCH